MTARAGLLLLLLLGACAGQEGGGGFIGGGAAPPPVPPGPPEQLAARLPDRAAAFTRGSTTPIEQPSRGREVNYAAAGRSAAAVVQIWQASGESPRDGIESPAARAAFDQAVREAEQAGSHRRLQARDRFTLPAGSGAMLRCAAMHGNYARQPVNGLICAGAAGGALLRLRVVMPDHNPADARAFATAIATALRQSAR